MPNPSTTESAQLLPAVQEAFARLEPILEAIVDHFPQPGHPLAEPLVRLINWAGQQQIALNPWLCTPRRARP